MQEIVYKSNKRKIFLVLLAMICLTGIGATLCYLLPKLLEYYVGVLPIVAIILAYAVTGVGVIGIIAGIMRLLSTKFDLALTEKGIRNNAEFGKTGFIAWDEIERIEVNQMGMNTGIAIFLKNPEAFSKQLTGLKQMANEMMIAKYGTPCYINVTALKANADEIAKRMNDFINQHKSR